MTAVGLIKLGPKVSVVHLTCAFVIETHRAATRETMTGTFIRLLLVLESVSLALCLLLSISIYDADSFP